MAGEVCFKEDSSKLMVLELWTLCSKKTGSSSTLSTSTMSLSVSMTSLYTSSFVDGVSLDRFVLSFVELEDKSWGLYGNKGGEGWFAWVLDAPSSESFSSLLL